MIQLIYLVAGVCFVLSLGGLSAPSSARRGNMLGVLGMGLALLATVVGMLMSGKADAASLGVAATALVAGGAIGGVLASRVQMTSMPELVAILHSFVGAGAVLVGLAGYVSHPSADLDAGRVVHLVEVFLGVIIGSLTFTGSIIAFGKLNGQIGSKALVFPFRHGLNLVLLLATVALGAWFVASQAGMPLYLGLVVFGLLGVLLVMGIGGADMPVVVSMLNSYSGWAASATGFLLANDLLIIVGALVGSSGAILSYIMCKAMNRSIVSVILGGFGNESGGPDERAEALSAKGVNRAGPEDVAELLLGARSVVMVPGYGMAVAQAQHSVRELTELLQKKGATVRFAIHPVAGRLPGHMNVLLAEANVPYPIVLEMDEINSDMVDTDVVLVLGANDIVNPDALENPKSALAGMPVLEVWRAQTVVAIKRSLNPGFAGIDNPLYYKDNTLMLFGDARKMVEALVTQVKGGGHH
jgi:H+-translocating NAD(P) transhydrogenase subunit beta